MKFSYLLLPSLFIPYWKSLIEEEDIPFHHFWIWLSALSKKLLVTTISEIVLPSEKKAFRKKPPMAKLILSRNNPLQNIYTWVYLGTSKAQQSQENKSEYKRKKVLMCSSSSFTFIVTVRISLFPGLMFPVETKNYPHTYYIQIHARILEYFIPLSFPFSPFLLPPSPPLDFYIKYSQLFYLYSGGTRSFLILHSRITF